MSFTFILIKRSISQGGTIESSELKKQLECQREQG